MVRRVWALAWMALVVVAVPAAAQPLGTFRWQLQPYCNIVSVAVVQQGAQYQLDGTDDQCGAGQKASVTGLAFFNPDGSVGFGLNLVTTPGGVPVHVDATITISTLSGTWRDSAGSTGAFTFTPGAGTGGAPRPAAIAGDITAVTAGTGLTGGAAADAALLAVDFATTQQRVSGTCPASQLMIGVNQDGTVTCQSVTAAGGGDITGVTAGAGLTGGGPSGNVALAVNFGGPGAATLAARSDHTHQVGDPAMSNVSVGPWALVGPTGGGNTAMGSQALQFNTAGLGNTAMGYQSLRANTVANFNTAIGRLAMLSNTTGFSNTAVGAGALSLNSIGFQNVAIGFNALNMNTVGDTTAVGFAALRLNTTGPLNTAVGTRALENNVTGGNNTAVGVFALASTTANANTAIGAVALMANTTGSENTAVGNAALAANTTGLFNTAVGAVAMQATTTGGNNTAVGRIAMQSNTTGSSNTAVGAGALNVNSAGSENVAIGFNALSQNTASDNTAVGYAALGANAGGPMNTAVGSNALLSNTVGTNNLALGSWALISNVSGLANIAVGGTALSENTTGSYNVAVGHTAGFGITTGSNNIHIGFAVASDSSGESNTIRIGNSSATSTFIRGINGATSSGGVGVFVNASGQLGTSTSAARFKQDITPLGDSLHAQVQALTPVSFVYKPEFDDGSKQIQYGLIAEDVARTFPELLVRDDEGRPQTVRYHLLTPLLLAEVQRLERARDAQARRLEEQATLLESHAREMTRLRAMVDTLAAAVALREQR